MGSKLENTPLSFLLAESKINPKVSIAQGEYLGSAVENLIIRVNGIQMFHHFSGEYFCDSR